MSAEPVACRVRVEGRVQGVAFRWHTCERARALGLAGWVRNLRDGAVEAHVEGPAEQVDALVDWLRAGPPLAGVARVERRPAAHEGVQGFEITR